MENKDCRMLPVKTSNMNSGAEVIFNSLMKHQKVSEAMDFISSFDQKCIPDSSVIQTIIFDILMTYKGVRLLAETKAYILDLLEVYPPCDEVRRKYYLSGLCSSRSVLSELWPMFSHIVSSCLCHYGVYVRQEDDGGPELIPFPNCTFLLDLYVRILVKDTECFLSESTIYAVFKKNLLAYLLWPNPSVGQLKHNGNLLLKWINDIYRSPQVEKMSSVLDSLHEVQCLMIKCIIERKHNLLEIGALNSPYLDEIVDDIMSSSNDSFASLTHFNTYINSLSLKYVKAKISEKTMAKLLSRPKTLRVLTLRNIVYEYMFPCKQKKKRGKASGGKSIVSKGTKRQNLLMKTKKSSRGGTKLHELCQSNSFGDLAILLKKEGNVNAQNNAGNTPLHEACLAKAHYCVGVLIAVTGKDGIEPVDLRVVNKDGHTPLHYAVMMNDVAIVKTLLINGGTQLLKIVDHKGKSPHDFAETPEMKELLQKFEENSLCNAADDTTKETITWKAPLLKCYKDYGIYLHALNYLLCFYCDIFQIYAYILNDSTESACHETKKCYHYPKNEDFSEIAPCSDDVEMIEEFPNLINKFIASVTTHAKELELLLDLELIPLRTFAASLRKQITFQ